MFLRSLKSKPHSKVKAQALQYEEIIWPVWFQENVQLAWLHIKPCSSSDSRNYENTRLHGIFFLFSRVVTGIIYKWVPGIC